MMPGRRITSGITPGLPWHRRAKPGQAAALGSHGSIIADVNPVRQEAEC
jgi:hypothetical protein